MPISFIDNYPKNKLEKYITDSNGDPHYGEIWAYGELLKFSYNNFIPDDTWYVKHNYQLSTHPGSSSKVEGQIDFLVLNQFGLLIIEIKGGGIEVDEKDTWYSYLHRDPNQRYKTQNPFIQAKEYVHSLKILIDADIFIYRAVIFPHEVNFELIGPQLMGYKFLLFTKRDLDIVETEFGKNKLLFNFLTQLPFESRRNILKQLYPTMNPDQLNSSLFNKFPLLRKREIERIKAELWPVQSTYGFEPDKIRNELIINENYEILKGLRKNRKVMVQGTAGTGKTTLAIKFLADNLLKQQKGIYLCSNKLLRSKMEFLIKKEYGLNSNDITFKIYHDNLIQTENLNDLDFIIIDEAQEMFSKNLFELILHLEKNNSNPKMLMLFDPEQTILQDYKDINWYLEFYSELGFVTYLFDTKWRSIKNPAIENIIASIKSGNYETVVNGTNYKIAVELSGKLKEIKTQIDKFKKERNNSIILIDSKIIDSFKEIAIDYFNKDIEELTEMNINIKSTKLRYTTPIKFRGLEAENVIMITPDLNGSNKTENFIGTTRAIYDLRIIIWK